MIELSLNNVEKYFGANRVLKNITFEVNKGERIGIVGRNGCGKSTVLKLIYGTENLDNGSISIRRGASIGYLEQIHGFEEGSTVREILNIAFDELLVLEKKMKSLESIMSDEREDISRLLSQYSELQQNYEVLGGYDKEEKLSKVCEGLKFKESFLDRSFDLLSGGEKTTVVLGKILLENPDILLLDEPTNHLDMESLEWLEEYLRNYKGTVIIVSHDRYFLDNVITKTIEIEDLISTSYKGNYSAYVKEKEDNLLQQYELYKVQQKKINSMEKSIKTLRDWANRSGNEKFYRRAFSMQKRLEKMDKVDKPKTEKVNMHITISQGDRSAQEVIKVISASKRFEDKILFVEGDLLVRFKERVALIGANGSGKSTLLKTLLKEESLDSGVSEIGANVKLAYLPQNIIFNNEELTVLECFREDVEILEGKAREYLAKYMFFGEIVFKKVKGLSGGERTRLKLSKLLYHEANLLILDEPTNHLDIDSIETLEDTLDEFKGTIFFISHDRYFINKMSSRIVALEGGKFNSYLGDYDYYKVKKNEREEIKIDIKPLKIEKQQKTKANNNQNNSYKLNKLEEKIVEIEKEIKALDELMETIQGNYEEINKCFKNKENLQVELELCMEEWLYLTEQS
ncbi:ribosomal protection-like ABC-F family protein [Clostridium intestinale]|uniref:ribosomal protection-like ABC-F family protein n=1 Tax=Clostridium intestinale TaxID=36845 RepID=UPI002DD69D5A|nr:ABC-F family ATP-binding cassette domain-containing protein [Clostridium intestinale]WRY50540.1 ABC-F family ATP-binding cassette domain-containing protein [Clostridium intestinale]